MVTAHDVDEVLTDDQGRPIPRPCRADYPTDAAYFAALDAFHARVHDVANAAFDSAFRAALRKP